MAMTTPQETVCLVAAAGRADLSSSFSTTISRPSQYQSPIVLGCQAILVLAMVGACSPTPRPTVPAPAPSEPPRFTEWTKAAGLNFTHLGGTDGSYYFPEVMAPGAALFDFDLDGDLDILLIDGLPKDSGGAPSPATSKRLFQQDDNGEFVDVTAGSGLDDPNFGMGVAIGDVNNDGFPDVYVTNAGTDQLFLNQGHGTFVDVTEQAGIDNLRWGTSASFVDYDRDGWLDLFVTNYVDYDPSRKCLDPRGRQDYCGPQNFQGTADKLYRNVSASGEGNESERVVRFADTSLASGIARQRGPGLGVLCADFNDDGWQDIFVANDGTANFLWINQQDGTFVDEGILWGCAYDNRGSPQASMGVALGDLDGDSKLDLFVTHLAGENNAFYAGAEEAGFQDQVVQAGLADASFRYTGFGTVAFDVEHDGDLDLAIANGRVKRAATPDGGAARPAGPKPGFWGSYQEPNQLFLNDGQGHFRLLQSDTDPFVATREVSRGLVAGDLDNDGDLDLLVTNAAGPVRLYRNDAEKQGAWLSLRAVYPEFSERDAYGALITISAGGNQWTQLVNPSCGYLSSNDPRVHFGLGKIEQVDSILVRWPDGSQERFEGGAVNQRRVLRHGEGRDL